jgi:hypothetical protein
MALWKFELTCKKCGSDGWINRTEEDKVIKITCHHCGENQVVII